MAMRLAGMAPIPPPTTRPSTIRPMVVTSETLATHSVVAMASAMPIMPLRLPAWLVAGDDRPFSARMKRTPGTRERRAAISAFILLRLLLVHRQHAGGDQEAAEDVHARHRQREDAENLG